MTTSNKRLSQNEQDYIVALKNSLGIIIGGITWEQINEPYRRFLFDNTNVQIFFGGGSSGKSHFIFQRTILDVWLQGRNFLIARQKKNTLENSVYTELLRKINDFGLQDKFICKKNPMSITCKENNRQILFIGLDDIESVKSIVPLDGTFTDVIVEEATETKEKDFEQLRIRQRGICYKKNGKQETKEILPKRTTLMFNPIDKSHWIFKRFFISHFEDNDREVHYEEKVQYDVMDDYGKITRETGVETFCILKTTYRDNKFLSVDDIIKLENTKDPVQREVYVNGNWGSLGKTVYQKGKNWFVEDLSDKIKDFKILRNGLDFGGAIDEHAYIKTSLDMKNKTIYIFDEFKMNEISIAELWTQIRSKVGSYPIICDRNEDMIKQLRECGANPYRARKGKNSVKVGIDWLRGFRIVVDKTCKEMQFELENYVWKTNKYGEPIEIPIDKYNHLCLTGDTIVKTFYGDYPIKNLLGKTGMCYCYDLERKELMFSCFNGVTLTQKNAEIYRLELENGSVLRGTYNHPVLTENGFKELIDINNNDVVIIVDNNMYKSTSKVKDIHKEKDKQDVYNMNVEKYHNYIANGMVVKNCDALRYAYSYDIIKNSSVKTNIDPYRR
jgi:phage terminase large subunit